MANRVFQNVVYQMKDAIDRVVGVVDETGAVIACSELGQIGEMREGFAVARLTAGDAFEKDGYAYHHFSNAKHNDYAAIPIVLCNNFIVSGFTPCCTCCISSGDKPSGTCPCSNCSFWLLIF